MFPPAGVQVVKQRILARAGDIRVLGKVPIGIEQRVGLARRCVCRGEVVLHRVHAGLRNVGIVLQVKRTVEQTRLEQESPFGAQLQALAKLKRNGPPSETNWEKQLAL